jgi:hypothetical protein
MTVIPALDAAVKRLMVLDQESVFALVDIAEERVRQISGENWSPEHDNKHAGGELAKAAAAYALAPHTHKYASSLRPTFWPWDQSWWKPKSTHLNQVRAGALLVAEMARRLRMASR